MYSKSMPRELRLDRQYPRREQCSSRGRNHMKASIRKGVDEIKNHVKKIVQQPFFVDRVNLDSEVEPESHAYVDDSQNIIHLEEMSRVWLVMELFVVIALWEQCGDDL